MKTKKALIFMNENKIIMILLVVLLLNGWYFGTKWYEGVKKDYYNAGIQKVFQVAQEAGQVTLNGVTLILYK